MCSANICCAAGIYYETMNVLSCNSCYKQNKHWYQQTIRKIPDKRDGMMTSMVGT